MAASLLIQPSANVPGKQVPATKMGDMEGGPGSQLHPGPALAVAQHWEGARRGKER